MDIYRHNQVKPLGSLYWPAFLLKATLFLCQILVCLFFCHISFLICGGFVKLCNVFHWIYLSNLWFYFFLNIFFFWDVVFHFVRFLPSKLWTPWRRDQTDDMSIMRMWHHPEMMLHYLIPLTWHFHGTLNAEVSIALGADGSAAGECLSAAQFKLQFWVLFFASRNSKKSKWKRAHADVTKMCVSYFMLYSSSLQKNKKDLYVTTFHCMMCNFSFSVLDVFASFWTEHFSVLYVALIQRMLQLSEE